MSNAKVRDFMSFSPDYVGPEATLTHAALRMKEIDCGVLPVGTNDKIEGVITDRDIVIRAIAEGMNPAHEKVKNYMSKDVYGCKENDSLKKAANEMRKHNVGRLIVRNDEGRMTGILTFGHILRNDADTEELANVVELAVGRTAA